MAIPDRYAPSGYVFERSCRIRILANLFEDCDDFDRGRIVRRAVHPNVSRQRGRRFNDLQGPRVPNSATAFDNRRRMVLKEKIPLTKEPFRRQAVRWSGCGAHRQFESAAGHLGVLSPGITTGMGGASLDWDRRRRVTPFRPRPRKPGLKPSLWDGITPLGESRGGTPTGVRAPSERAP